MHVRTGGAIVVIVALTSPAFAQPETAADTPPADSSAAPPPGVPIAPPSIPPPVPDKPAPKLTFEPYGFLRLQYLMVQNDPNVAFVGRDDGFELQNARLGVRGKLADRVRYAISLEGAVDERKQVNTPDGKLQVALKDAYSDVALASGIEARAGYFLTLVDPNLTPDTERELVDRPIESRGMRATEGYQTEGLTPGRSLGAALRMVPTPPTGGARVGVEVAVQNGADEYASNNDNDKPAVSASALVLLPNASWIVVSGRYNPRSVGDLPFRRDETDLQGTAGLRVAAGPVVLDAGAVIVRTTFATTDLPTENAFGAHAQIGVKIPGTLPVALAYRFGILDPSSLIITDRVMEHTVGAVLSVPAYRMRVQLQATHVIEQAARTLSNDRLQLAAELAL